MRFPHGSPNTIALFVIPAKAGPQIRDVLVDYVFPRFPPCFPVRASLGPRVRGDDERGRESGDLGRGFGKGDNTKPVPEIRSDLRASQKSKMTLFKRVNKINVPSVYPQILLKRRIN
jgi:hypothetical protein